MLEVLGLIRMSETFEISEHVDSVKDLYENPRNSKVYLVYIPV